MMSKWLAIFFRFFLGASSLWSDASSDVDRSSRPERFHILAAVVVVVVVVVAATAQSSVAVVATLMGDI